MRRATRRSPAATGTRHEGRSRRRSATRSRPRRSTGSAGRCGGCAESQQAVVHRERAYSGFRRDGELARAARIALWLSREYALVWDNEAAANGWLARAERLLADVAPVRSTAGSPWPGRSGRREPVAAARLAAFAVDVASETRDVDLELRALAQLGPRGGVRRRDRRRARAAWTRRWRPPPGARRPRSRPSPTSAARCCSRASVPATASDRGSGRRSSRRSRVATTTSRCSPSAAAAAPTCTRRAAASTRPSVSCLEALRELDAAGQRARCVHPAARLAEIRVLQGRLEEAEQYLAGLGDEPEAVAGGRRPPPGPGRARGRERAPGAAARPARALEPARRAAARSPRPGEDRGRRPRGRAHAR